MQKILIDKYAPSEVTADIRMYPSGHCIHEITVKPYILGYDARVEMDYKLDEEYIKSEALRYLMAKHINTLKFEYDEQHRVFRFRLDILAEEEKLDFLNTISKLEGLIENRIRQVKDKDKQINELAKDITEYHSTIKSQQDTLNQPFRHLINYILHKLHIK